MVKAVLFDLDNTLIDFMRMKTAACDAALDAMIASGLKLDRKQAVERLRALFDKLGIENQHIFDEFLMDVEGSVDYNKLAHAVIAYRKMRAGHLQPYPDVIKTLITLKSKGLKLGIISDAPRLQAWLRLVEMGLDDFFDIVVTNDDTGKFKPDAAPFLEALKQLDLPASEVLMVGDKMERDVEGAKKVGLKTALAAYGAGYPMTFSTHPLVEVDTKADFILERFGQLAEILR